MLKRRRRTQVSGATVSSRQSSLFQTLLVLILIGGTAAALYWWFSDRVVPKEPTLDPRRVAELQRQLETLTEERDRLSALANAAELEINVERATQKQLAEQVRNLTEENIRLKEDLAFFERLLPSNTNKGVSIRRLRAELIAPNQIRYRLLIMQGGKNPPSFVGELQLAVILKSDEGKPSAMMVFPEKNTAERQRFSLNFRQYQRVEGVLNLPEGAAVSAVQARVLEKGVIRTQQMVNL